MSFAQNYDYTGGPTAGQVDGWVSDDGLPCGMCISRETPFLLLLKNLMLKDRVACSLSRTAPVLEFEVMNLWG